MRNIIEKIKKNEFFKDIEDDKAEIIISELRHISKKYSKVDNYFEIENLETAETQNTKLKINI